MSLHHPGRIQQLKQIFGGVIKVPSADYFSGCSVLCNAVKYEKYFWNTKMDNHAWPSFLILYPKIATIQACPEQP